MANSTPGQGKHAEGTEAGKAKERAGGQDAMGRADAMLTDAGQRLGQWGARLQQESARLAARAREELEDMWAEAQALRHQQHTSGERSQPPGEAGHP
jgi:hypothetical protein